MVFKRKSFVILVFVCSFACVKTKPGWKNITISHYLLDIPESFNLKYERGFDSQPGYIKGADFTLFFDYGAFTDTLFPTRKQFLANWKRIHSSELGDRYMKPNVVYDSKTEPKVNIFGMRTASKKDSVKFGSCDMVALCQHLRDTFDYPVIIPQEIKDHIFKIDTVQHHFRKLIYPLKGKKGDVGVFIRDERGNMFNGNIYPALAISSRDLNAKQQQLAVEILKTLTPKQKQK